MLVRVTVRPSTPVGCRRRPALLCIPSSTNNNNNNERSKSARRNKEVYLPRAPRCPPSPAPHEKPLRVLPGGWAEFYCSDAGGAGRIFYFHAITGERSWKPPRTRRIAGDGKPADGEESSAREDGSSTRSRSPSPVSESTPVPLVLPPGWEERYDDEAEQNCYFHKDSGAKAVRKDVPESVARWLNELRRDTDSTEIDEELRLRVECEAVASEVELLPSPPPSSKQRAPQDLVMVHDILSITEDTPPPRQDNVWNHNPVFKSINKEEKTTKTEEQCNQKSSFKSLCNEARRASESLISNLPGSEYKDCESCSSVQGVDLVSVDLELEQLSERALSIADEALAECASERARTAAIEVPHSRVRSTSAASELSDDVFFSVSSSASIPADVNKIFDSGAHGESPPVAPPRRKKTNNESPTSDSKESKEIFQQIEIFTSKAIKNDLDLNNTDNLSTKTMIKSNNNKLPEKPLIPKRPVIFDSSKMFSKDSKPTQKVVDDDKQRGGNNQVTKDEITGNKAVREDKTRLTPEGREEPSSGLSDNDSEICDPVFAQRFSLQIVDRQTYYPEIQRNNRLTVPELSQEVQALYLDEAKLIDNQKNQSSINNKSIKEENHESVTTTTTTALKTKLENTSISSNKKEVLESIKDTSLLKNQNNNTELLSMNENYSTSNKQSEKVADTESNEPPREDAGPLSAGGVVGEGEANWSQLEAEESFRSRKGSFSSDIVAWKQELLQQWDRLEDDEEPAYTAGPQPEEWFSSSDREGRLYFFEENSNESSWTLPDDVDHPAPSSTPTPTTPTNKSSLDKSKRQTSAVSAAVAAVTARQGAAAERRPLGPAFEPGSRSTIAATLLHAQHSDDEDDEDSRTSPHVRARLPPGALLLPAYQQLARGNKTRSMVIEPKRVPSDETVAKTASIPRNWPQLLEAGMAVLKEGVLHKTKITENGKKLRKNWAPSHVVLTELLLLFFRDAKSFSAMKSGNMSGSKPELCVDLNGATVESGDKLSSRKNVFVVSTALGLQVLCQEENVNSADSWFYQLGLAIKNLGGGCNTAPRIKLLPASREQSPLQQEPSPEEVRAASVGRSRSVKIKKEMGSVDDLSASPTEQTKIKDRLKKFFVRRPTMESLVKKGIWKDEPAFGCYLGKLCVDEGGLQVPVFVQRCIAAIESKPENIKTDGLYRASGNLSQVQKIRLQVDQNNLSVLDQEEDVHVLTGALKLFFRELKEPLIPFDAFNKALKASTNPNKKEKLQHFREIVRHLPGPNHDTLQFLLQHLLRVTEQQASNRMHIPNLAIVFGPTLMWPEQESLNMALDLMQQNIVIESLLQDYDNIFR